MLEVLRITKQRFRNSQKKSPRKVLTQNSNEEDILKAIEMLKEKLPINQSERESQSDSEESVADDETDTDEVYQ